MELIYANEHHYNESLEYLERSLKIAKEINNVKILAGVYRDLADIRNYLNEYDNAVKLYNESMIFMEILGNKHEIASILHQLGFTYSNMGKYDESIIFCKKSLKISMQLGYINLSAKTLASLGYLFVSKKDYKNALKCYISALKLFKSLNSSDVNLVERDIDFIKYKVKKNNFEQCCEEINNLIKAEGLDNLISEFYLGKK